MSLKKVKIFKETENIKDVNLTTEKHKILSTVIQITEELKMRNSKKGLLEKILNYLESKILDKDLSDDQKAHKIIILTSCLCSVIATQPLPFADIFILTPIQIIMAKLLSIDSKI